MPRVAIQLEAWRCAERQRRALPAGSPAWQAADEAAHQARTAYRAEVAQATAYYAEQEFAAHHRLFAGWLEPVDRYAAHVRPLALGMPIEAAEHRRETHGDAVAFDVPSDSGGGDHGSGL